MKPQPSTVLEGLLVAGVAVLVPLISMKLGLDIVVVGFVAMAMGLWLLYRALRYRMLQFYLKLKSKQRQQHQEAFIALNAALKPQFPIPVMKEWTITPDFANILVNAIGTHRPMVILECGSGVSTLIMCYAMAKYEGGRIHALEHMRVYVEATRQMLALHGFSHVGTVHHAELVPMQLGDGIWSWYDTEVLDNIAEIDMLIVDGPPGKLSSMARYPALPVLLHKLKQDAVVFLDDSDRPDERAIIEVWKSKYGFTEVTEYRVEHGVCALRRPGK